LQYPRDVQVLHEHSVIRLDEPRCELVLEVLNLPLDSAFDRGDLSALFLPVVAAVFFAEENSLFPAQALVLVGKVKPIHAIAV
jgi:hypothetical protein